MHPLLLILVMVVVAAVAGAALAYWRRPAATPRAPGGDQHTAAMAAAQARASGVLSQGECQCTPANPECSGPDFYTRSHASPDGLLLFQSSDAVPLASLQAGAALLRGMISPQLAAMMAAYKGQGGLRVAVIAASEQVSDLPEYCWLKTACTFDGRCYNNMRNIGAVSPAVPTVLTEADLVCAPDSPYYEENIPVHEFAHTVMDVVLREQQPDVHARILAAYDNALATGAIPPGLYISANAHEYWANLVAAYFNATARTDVNAGINTPATLEARDPTGYKIVDEVFRGAPGIACARNNINHYCCTANQAASRPAAP